MRLSRVLIVLAAALPMLAGCASSSTFAFPVEQGDVAAGREAFIAHRCQRCHTIAGETLPQPAGMSFPMLQLGAAPTKIRSYADLTTSIVNPNHALSERYRQQLQQTGVPPNSPMPAESLDTMTVRELIDIVAFLGSKYRTLVENFE
jgi:L-cysteine S-thiosulfotransferase